MILDLVELPAGDAGTIQTVELMAKLVDRAQLHPEVAHVARQIEAHAQGGDVVGTLRAWLGRRVRFTPDAWISHAMGLGNVPEFLTAPLYMVRQIREQGYAVGDCDDVAILGAALGRATGYQARFRVMAFGGPGDPFLHVFTELRDGRHWRELDTTKPEQELPPQVTREFVYNAA